MTGWAEIQRQMDALAAEDIESCVRTWPPRLRGRGGPESKASWCAAIGEAGKYHWGDSPWEAWQKAMASDAADKERTSLALHRSGL